ncbi:hypothetical protein [Frigoribacterium sp. VKM Ac-2836]|uniref:hypothetical protein n=1 Tax=Frigoribacterium sp. VKM Ac-2836 TaxID=2739014 RepID=UPI001564A34C|nr:hypothetical protein [Frigoribacterium sp. VKM Ac-2836]NRD25313.1 hypothetical protein [Frigoribacterium sp. VKM Ac-2836]
MTPPKVATMYSWVTLFVATLPPPVISIEMTCFPLRYPFRYEPLQVLRAAPERSVLFEPFDAIQTHVYLPPTSA